MTDSGRRTAWLLRSIGLAAAYALLATLVSGFFSANGVFTVIWPPSGLALAALLIGGKRYLPGIYAGALAASLLAGSPLWVAIVIAAGNTAEALIGYTLLQRAGCADPSLRGVAGYFQLLFRAAGLATLIGATIGTLTLLLSGVIQTPQLAVELLQGWMGDALGIMLVTPLLLVWRELPQGWRQPGQRRELLALFVLHFSAAR